MKRIQFPVLWNKNFNWPKITNQGKIALIGILLVGYFAYLYPTNPLYFLFSLLLSLFLFSLIYSCFSLNHLTISRNIPRVCHFGEEIDIGLHINYEGWLPLFGLFVEDGAYSVVLPLDSKHFIKEISPCSISFHQYQTRIKKRGEFYLSYTRISTEFPLGFFRKEVEFPCHSEIMVYPSLGTLNLKIGRALTFPFQKEEAHRQKGNSLEYLGVREYRRGDEMRHIHWKLSARYRQTLVKEYYKPNNPRALILLDNHLPSVCTQKDTVYLEKAISFCGALAQLLIQSQYSVGFCTYLKSPNVMQSLPGQEQYIKIMKTLSLVEPCILSHFEEMLSLLDANQLCSNLVFCVFPMFLSKEESMEKMKQKIYYLGAKGLSQEKRKARRKIEREKKKVKISRGESQSYLDHLYIQLKHEDPNLEQLDLHHSHQFIFANNESFQKIFVAS